jgi:Mce-associated membrane protein
VSKHSEDQTVEEETTVAPTDTETEQADETATDESVDKTDEADAVDKADEADAVDKADEPTETADEAPDSAELDKPKRRIQWARVFAFGVLPAVALLLAMGAGYLKWMDNSVRSSETARIESMQAAKDSTIALLSYKPDTVEQQLGAARDLLTGDFRDSYTSLTNDVVIPGAKQKQISAVATVPAVASVAAKPNQAVVLVFVNQTVIVGQDAPTDTASSVRVTLDKVGDRWLIAKFDPV